MILRQVLKGSIRKHDVIDLFRSINLQYGIIGVRIRNDNGSPFIANDVKRYLKEMEALQEFTHIATPEENAYIEAFHSIVQREVVKRHEFSSFYEAISTFQRHLQWYNHTRKHCAIGRITPAEKWNQYEKQKAITSIILALRGKRKQALLESILSGTTPPTKMTGLEELPRPKLKSGFNPNNRGLIH